LPQDLKVFSVLLESPGKVKAAGLWLVQMYVSANCAPCYRHSSLSYEWQ